MQFFKRKNRQIESSRYLLDIWHILPQQENELDPIIRLLKANQELNIEINSHESQNEASDIGKKSENSLEAREASNYIISCGIDSSRVSCCLLAQSSLPMFRLIRKANSGNRK